MHNSLRLIRTHACVVSWTHNIKQKVIWSKTFFFRGELLLCMNLNIFNVAVLRTGYVIGILLVIRAVL